MLLLQTNFQSKETSNDKKVMSKDSILQLFNDKPNPQSFSNTSGKFKSFV